MSDIRPLTVADPGFGQGGPIGWGGPTLKREGYTPDFIENCAKQRKMYAQLWGWGDPGLRPPGSATVSNQGLRFYFVELKGAVRYCLIPLTV